MDNYANKSPAGLLIQTSLTSASPVLVFQADLTTHINRIHLYTPGLTAATVTLYHLELSETVAADKNVILRPTVASGAVWVFETPSLGATISLSRGHKLHASTDQPCSCSIYGHAAER